MELGSPKVDMLMQVPLLQPYFTYPSRKKEGFL